MRGFRAQLNEHRTGIAEVTCSNAIKALIFFFFFANIIIKNVIMHIMDSTMKNDRKIPSKSPFAHQTMA